MDATDKYVVKVALETLRAAGGTGVKKSALLSQMELFISRFGELKDALAAGDKEKMREMMRISTERRKCFDKR